MPEARKNAASRWTEPTTDRLFGLLHAESEGLESDTCPVNVMCEVADVANLAFMYAEVRSKELLTS